MYFYTYPQESREKSLVEKKPGRKNGSGKKAWSVLEKMEKKPGVFFLRLMYIKINDEINLIHYFNHLI